MTPSIQKDALGFESLEMPALSLRTITGDVTQEPLVERSFQVRRTEINDFELNLDGTTARIPGQEWWHLSRQVGNRELTRWKHSVVGGPLGRPDVRRIVLSLDSTPSYQLFLAAFEIGDFIRLADAQLPQIVARFEALAGVRLGDARRGVLYFVPGLLIGDVHQESIDALVKNNKLCRAKLHDGEVLRELLYTPYQTPSGFKRPVSVEAQMVWERIRRGLRDTSLVS